MIYIYIYYRYITFINKKIAFFNQYLQCVKDYIKEKLLIYFIPKYPNILLFEAAEIVVLTIPKPGMINMQQNNFD